MSTTAQNVTDVHDNNGGRCRGNGADASVALDVRPVEPKDRFECIMGTYEALAIGDSLLLTVDHDPLCMYYTLRATRGDDSFSFDYLENGPETWRVKVTRLAADTVDAS